MAQEFYINKNSVLPHIRMELINDGRHDFNKFYEAIQNASITFSMTNVDNGIMKIANAKASIVPRENNSCVDEFVIVYEWKERDTKQPGIYRGQFKINFNPDLVSGEQTYPVGELIMPIQDELMIYIMDGVIKK